MKQKDVWLLLGETLKTKILRCEAVDGGTTRFRVLAEGFVPLFCKIDPEASGSIAAEADGLGALRTHVAVPETFAVTDRLLVVEQIHSKLAGHGFAKSLAASLIDLHKKSSPYYGWHRDNFIGRSIQWNRAEDCTDWADFFWEYRLNPQLQAIPKLGVAAKGNWIGRLEEKMRGTLASVTEAPSLLHGDLWSGNVLCDDEDQAVFIDPAVSFGHREMDFALMHIFGGFSREFFQTYDKLWPFESGSETRGRFYQLYHLLNHAQIFGNSYWRQAWALIQSLIPTRKAAEIRSVRIKPMS